MDEANNGFGGNRAITAAYDRVVTSVLAFPKIAIKIYLPVHVLTKMYNELKST